MCEGSSVLIGIGLSCIVPCDSGIRQQPLVINVMNLLVP